MLYLDANAFYWYYGRDKLPLSPSFAILDVEKFCSFLDSRTDKSLPASVFIEMIVHFRDDPTTIRKVVSFREEKKIQIYNNVQDYCFCQDELKVLHVAISNINISDITMASYANKLLDKKIDIEVTHAHIFLQIVSLLYINNYLECTSDLDNGTKNNLLLFLGNELSNELKNNYIKQLTNELKNGYAENDKSQQYLKKQYMKLLVQNCVTFKMIIDTTLKVLKNEKNLYDAMCKSASDARSKGFTDEGMMTVIKNALENDDTFKKEAKIKVPNMFIQKGYSKHQAEYIKFMMEAWIERPQKLRKNDIFDMLYVGSIDKQVIDPKANVLLDQTSYLLTFDENIEKFLSGSESNINLIDSFKLSK